MDLALRRWPLTCSSQQCAGDEGSMVGPCRHPCRAAVGAGHAIPVRRGALSSIGLTRLSPSAAMTLSLRPRRSGHRHRPEDPAGGATALRGTAPCAPPGPGDGARVVPSGKPGGLVVLEPVPSLENHVQTDTNHPHQADCKGVSEGPPQLWHVLKVHAVDSSYECRGEQDRRPRRDLLEVVYRVALTCSDVAETVADLV